MNVQATETREQKRARIESYEYLSKRFHLDPRTGLLFWKRWPCNLAGTIAKARAGYQFRKIVIEGLDFKQHRLVWILRYRERLPVETHVDHENNDSLDNRPGNLRPATAQMNCANARLSRANRTGFKGVSVHECGKFVANITVNRHMKYLGLYDTAEEAAAVYAAAAEKYFGEFAKPATSTKD